MYTRTPNYQQKMTYIFTCSEHNRCFKKYSTVYDIFDINLEKPVPYKNINRIIENKRFSSQLKRLCRDQTLIMETLFKSTTTKGFRSRCVFDLNYSQPYI